MPAPTTPGRDIAEKRSIEPDIGTQLARATKPVSFSRSGNDSMTPVVTMLLLELSRRTGTTTAVRHLRYLTHLSTTVDKGCAQSKLDTMRAMKVLSLTGRCVVDR